MGNSDLLAKPAPPELARDLEADLAICEAATPGKWKGNHAVQPYISVFTGVAEEVIATAHKRKDMRFMVEAREGWPYAIRLALEYEKEIDRLQNELQIYQEQEHGIRGPWD